MIDAPLAPSPVIAPAFVFEAPGVLDVEASGSAPDGYPIEIGFVLPNGDRYCSLIRPAPQWSHWDPQAERVHRIPIRTMMSHGRELVEVATQLNQRLQGLTLYVDGGASDRDLVDVLFRAANMTRSFELADLGALLSDREAALWDVLKQQVATEMNLQRHRASSDAKLLRHALMRLRGPLPKPPVV